MHEKLSSQNQPNRPENEQLEIDPLDHPERFKTVHSRFNLALHGAHTADVIATAEDQARYLIVPISKASDKISKQLRESEIPLLESFGQEGNFEVYGVDLQAKPMVEEQLFPGMESTETYISDKELFSDLGGLWRRIYDATQALPAECILSRTGMREFVKKGEERLFPVPPYDDWKKIESIEEAVAVFSEILTDELLQTYPNKKIGDLVEAASRRFGE